MHVLQTDGKGHGDRGTIPDDKKELLDSARKANEKNVVLDYPESQNLEDVERLDTYTGKIFQGKRGLMIHLGQKAGQNNIPEHVTDMHDAEEFPIVETDENGNIVNIIKPAQNDVPSATPYLPWTGSVPRSKIKNFIEEVKEGTGAVTADVIEERLLD